MTPRQTYIIASTPRTGSLLLCQGLGDTGIAGRPDEFFGPLTRAEWLRQWGLPPHCAGETFWQAALRQGTTANGVHGLKIHFRQCAYLAMLLGLSPEVDVLRERYPEARFINLVRRDVRAQAISLFRAFATNEWHLTPKHPVSQQAAPLLDMGKVLTHEQILRQEQHRWERYFRQRGITPLVIEYETLCTDYASQIARCLAYLGLDPSAARALPPPRLRRQADSLTSRWRDQIDTQEAQYLRPTTAPEREIIIVPQFYEHPLAVRDYALRQDYYTPYQRRADLEAGKRATWWATRFKAATACPFKSSPVLLQALERATGDTIDLDHWRLPYPVDGEGQPIVDRTGTGPPRSALWNCCFHVKPEIGQQLGAGVHSHTDADNWNAAGEEGWAGLIYLSPDAPLDGGLHLWRNKDPEHQYDWMTPADNWELVDRLGNVFNRLILCRGRLPHSGANGWGDSLETGRLFQTFFWKIKR